jgi:hypothetical protein
MTCWDLVSFQEESRRRAKELESVVPGHCLSQSDKTVFWLDRDVTQEKGHD